jgi:alpha-tubulin suppressor-like RCC1 family protein
VGVSGLASGVTAIAGGRYFSCAVASGGGVVSWGQNAAGNLGDGSKSDSFVPVAVSGLSSGMAAVAAGVYFACALSTTGGLQCWGTNDRGELGNGTKVGSSVPVHVTGF